MRRPPSIQHLIALAAIAPALAIAAVLFLLFTSSAREVSERLGDSLVDHATSQVRSDVSSYLGSAVRVSDRYAHRAARGELPFTGLAAWEASELADIAVNPDIASVCFGSVTGEATWVLRRAGRVELGRVEADGTAREFVVDPSTGAIETTPFRTYHYDPRERPWYGEAVRADAAVWTPVYFWYGNQGADSETGTGYARPIRTADGQLAGVLVIDVTLRNLSTFLRSLPLAESGWLCVVDPEGLLVASSRGDVNSARGTRLGVADLDHSAGRAVLSALGSAAPGAAGTMVRAVADEPVRIHVGDLSPYPGINWRLAAVVPEAAFLRWARAVQRHALVAGLLAAAGGVLFAIFLGQRVSTPLLALTEHVRRLGEGRLDSRIELNTARELRVLSDATNSMAAGLTERMELRHSLALAMQVQQSLLPTTAPDVAGLDIAGTSRYCDATGGDYFDFIEVSGLPGGRLLIAVGDVTGHGIAAALLMTTARAALRAHASRGGSLGELMTRVNSLLARDARHGRFMTMVFAVIDPKEGTLRWASAGHDPPIIFDATTGTFRELEGGDLPLGVADGIEYEELTLGGIGPGTTMVIGTDGIWEAANKEGEYFGKDRLRAIIRGGAGLPSESLAKRIEASLDEYCATDRHADDVTMVVLRITEPAPAESSPLVSAGASA